MFINLLSGVLPGKMYFAVETERNGLPRTSNIIYTALIGAELLLAQQFEPLVFISGVLNPWLIGFAVVSVIYAASNYSLHSSSWAPVAFNGDREPKALNPCKVGAGESIPARWAIGSLVNTADEAGAGAGWKFGRRKGFLCSEVGCIFNWPEWHLAQDRIRPCKCREGDREGVKIGCD